MAGTVLVQLSATHQADNTAITAANSGFGSGSVGTGNTAVHLDASKMGASEGYQFTQAGANSNIWYLDAPSAAVKLSIRFPFRYAATPTATTVAVLRAYPDTTHVTNIWTLLFTSSNRMQFLEAATGGLNVTSAAGTPMVPGNDYVAQILVSSDTSAMSLNVYPRGSTTALFSLSGALVGPSSMQSVRVGIGTASALGQLNTNDTLALGSGDFLTRADIANVAPTLSLTGSQNVAAGANVTATATATDSDGSIASYSWSVVGGSSTSTPTLIGGATSSVSFTAPAAGNLITLQCVVTDNGGATATATTEVRVPLTGTTTVRTLALAGTGAAWTNTGGTANDGAALADDLDTTYLESPAVSATESARRVRLQPANTRASLQVKLRLFTDTGTANTSVRLYEGTTLRQTWTQAVTTTATEYTFTAAAGTISAVGDWGNLFVEVGATS